MSWWRRLGRSETVFQPLAHRSRLAAVSAALLAVALVGLLFAGFDPGTDFTGGGTSVETENASGLTLTQYRAALDDAGFGGVRVQRTVDGQGILVRGGEMDQAERETLAAAVAAAAGVDGASVTAEVTGATVDWEPATTILTATGIFAVLALLVVGWRIGLKAAAVAILVLVFDLTVTLGLFALTGLEVYPAAVVAVVGIVAYSLYDTVVVQSRIKDLHGELGSRFDFEYIANTSFNKVLVRSIVTAATVAVPGLVLLVVAAMRPGTAMLTSVLAVVLIGVLAATWSSPTLGIGLLALWPDPLPGPRTRGRARRRRRREPVRPATLSDETEETGAVPKPPRKAPKR